MYIEEGLACEMLAKNKDSRGITGGELLKMWQLVATFDYGDTGNQ